MLHSKVSSLACPQLLISLTAQFSEKDLFNTKYVFWFPLQILREAFIVLKSIKWDITIKGHTASCKFVFTLVRFYETGIFTTAIHKMQKKIQISIFVKILPTVTVKCSFSLNAKNFPFNQHSIPMSQEPKSHFWFKIQPLPLFWDKRTLVTPSYTCISDVFQY
jgi:hypothetical protein